MQLQLKFNLIKVLFLMYNMMFVQYLLHIHSNSLMVIISVINCKKQKIQINYRRSMLLRIRNINLRLCRLFSLQL